MQVNGQAESLMGGCACTWRPPLVAAADAESGAAAHLAASQGHAVWQREKEGEGTGIQLSP